MWVGYDIPNLRNSLLPRRENGWPCLIRRIIYTIGKCFARRDFVLFLDPTHHFRIDTNKYIVMSLHFRRACPVFNQRSGRVLQASCRSGVSSHVFSFPSSDPASCSSSLPRLTQVRPHLLPAPSVGFRSPPHFHTSLVHFPAEWYGNLNKAPWTPPVRLPSAVHLCAQLHRSR